MNKEEPRKNIYKSDREEYRAKVDRILQEIEKDDRTDNCQKSNKVVIEASETNAIPSKNHSGEAFMSTDELLNCWNEIHSNKFASPASYLENKENLKDKELLYYASVGMNSGKATGWDDITC